MEENLSGRSLEARLEQRPLAHRIADAAAARPTLSLREYSDDLAPEFHRLNAEWIEAMFSLEDEDRRILSDPRSVIIDRGGVVLFVEASDLGIIGTGALMKVADGVFELTKMAVTATARGRGAGEVLIHELVKRARSLGVDELHLLTHPKCDAAIRLYERTGFVHDQTILAKRGGRYARAKVAMRLPSKRLATAHVGAVRLARGKTEIAAAAELFREYGRQLSVDLEEQGLEAEIAGLPGAYASPDGALLLAFDHRGSPVGVVGVRSFAERETCELKRLYVRKTARGQGLGRQLLDAAVEAAEVSGYRAMVLDCIPELAMAIELYGRSGFVETKPYWNNTFPGARYFRRNLRKAPSI